MSAASFLTELRGMHAAGVEAKAQAAMFDLPVERITVGGDMDVDALGEFIAAVDSIHERAHALANRCQGSGLVLAELVEWRAKWATVQQPSALMAFEEFDEIIKLLSVEGRAVVDPPGTATTNAAVDGGGVAGGCVSAPPGLPSVELHPTQMRDLMDSVLVDLVEEARDLAKHLLDQGECPECHGGECPTCKGFGFIDDGIVGDVPECGVCKGEGGAPHLDGCRLATFPDRATKALS